MSEYPGKHDDLIARAEIIDEQLQWLKRDVEFGLGQLAAAEVERDTADYYEDLAEVVDGTAGRAGGIVDMIDQARLSDRVVGEELEMIDEAETFNVVRRFVDRSSNAPFTIADLQNHLKKNDIPLPEREGSFVNWTKGTFDEIEADRREKGIREKWVTFKHGQKTVYAFATMVVPEEHVSPVPVELQPEAAKLDTAGSDVIPNLQPSLPPAETLDTGLEQTLLDLIASHDGKLRRKQLYGLLGGDEVDAVSVRRTLDKLCDQGQLFKHRPGGILYFSTEEPVVRIAEDRMLSGERQQADEVLTESDIQLARAIIKVFGLPGIHTTQGLTPKEVSQRMRDNQFVSKSDNYQLSDIRKLARRLESIDILRTGEMAATKGGHRSRGMKVFKISAANQTIRNKLKDPTNTQRLLEDITSKLH